MQANYPRPDRRPSTARAIGLGVTVAVAIAALLVAAYTIGFDVGKPDKEVAQAPSPAPSNGGKEKSSGGGDAKAASLFKSGCGSCHVLKAAGTTGAVGPNLDDTKPNAKRIEQQIASGGGTMPAGLLKGAEAKSVSEYIAKVAGK